MNKPITDFELTNAMGLWLEKDEVDWIRNEIRTLGTENHQLRTAVYEIAYEMSKARKYWEEAEAPVDPIVLMNHINKVITIIKDLNMNSYYIVKIQKEEESNE